MSLLNKRQSIATLLADPHQDERLKQQLILSQALVGFAEAELGLSAQGSFQSYVELDHPYVVWNVFASAELSIEAHLWCYPLVGCLSYKGFFDREKALSASSDLQKQGFDTYVGGVRAYSTLGWFDDPLLSSFIQLPELELAELIFHELAHQRLFIKGDSDFNESFATVVAHQGTKLWAMQQGLVFNSAAAAGKLQQREEFAELILSYRQRLERIYLSPQSKADKLSAKQMIFDQLRVEYAAKRLDSWKHFTAFDHWMQSPLNNAKLNTIATYYRWLDALQARFTRQQGHFEDFFDELDKLAKLTIKQRDKELSSQKESSRTPAP